MTVPAQTTLFNESTANGLTTSFPYQFMIASADDLTVELDGVVTTTGFTVTGVGDEGGGAVVFSVAPANGVKVLRYLDPVLDRSTDYQQLGDFPANVVNQDYDRLWLAVQSMQAQIARAVKLPVATAENQVINMDTADRAGRVIGFNASGELVAMEAQTGTSLIDLAAQSGMSLIGGLNTFMKFPSQNPLGYGRNWFDICVPAVADFIDNVGSVQNKSSNGTIWGNAAWAFLDLAGTERGAMGYSRNATLQPGGYYANTLYCEIGNPFTTDSDVTHFRVINTIKAGGPFWSGAEKSYFPIEVRSDTGAVTLSNGGGSAPVTFLAPNVAFGDLSLGATEISIPGTNTVSRWREYQTADSFSWVTNVESSTLNTGGDIVQTSASKSSWKVSMGYGNGSAPYDSFRISRAAPGATSWTDFISVDSSGNISCGGVNISGTVKTKVSPSTGWSMTVDDTIPVSVNNGSTYNLAAGSGLVMINDYTGGASAVFLCSASNIVLVSQTGTQFVVGAPGAGKVGLVWSGSAYQISNNKGSNTTFGVMTFATRQTN